MAPTVGVVVPAYRPATERLVAYLADLEGELDPDALRVELDDPDSATLDALEGTDVDVNAVPYRRGKGAAVTAGFEALDTDVRAFVDADRSTSAESFVDVITALSSAKCDLAVGSRRHPNATVHGHQTFARRWLGDGFARLAGRLLAVSLYDYQCGAKAISREGWSVARDHLYEAGFGWDVELIAIAGALDLRVEEVPIEWEDQPGSTVAPVRTSVGLLRTLIAARHRAKQLRNHPLHEAIATRRRTPTALVDRDE
jgi:glycosyltransferase involved in cell wall biosynthesis